MKKENIVKKYENTVKAISKANNVDMGVAFDMLLTMAENHAEKRAGDVYTGVSADFNWDSLIADMREAE